MEYKVGDKILVISGEEKGAHGTVTKVSDIDAEFKYEVTTIDGKVLWKRERSIQSIKNKEEPLKKRGRPAKKKSEPKPVVKENTGVVKEMHECTLLDRYLEFVSTLTLAEFIELRKIINNDYDDLSEMVSKQFGIRSDTN